MLKTLSAVCLAAAVLTCPQIAEAQSVGPMQPGQRVQLGPMMGERIVRDVMVAQNGGGVTIVYGMAPGQPESRRVLRLENVNGMLEVVYDTAVPDMPLSSGGTPRLVQRGGGMYSVEYDR
jgi:hypothetical protein